MLLFWFLSKKNISRLHARFIWINLVLLFPVLFGYDLIENGHNFGSKMGPSVISSSLFDFFNRDINLDSYRKHMLLKNLFNNHIYGFYQVFSLFLGVLFMSSLYFIKYRLCNTNKNKITFLKTYRFELIGALILFYLIYDLVQWPLYNSMVLTGNGSNSSVYIEGIIYVLAYFIVLGFVLFLFRKKELTRIKTLIFVLLFFLFPIISMSSNQFTQFNPGLEFSENLPIITPLFSGIFTTTTIFFQDLLGDHPQSVLHLKSYTIMEFFLMITLFPFLVKKYNNYVK